MYSGFGLKVWTLICWYRKHNIVTAIIVYDFVYVLNNNEVCVFTLSRWACVVIWDAMPEMMLRIAFIAV
jgi:hypothetical protein